MEKLQEHLCKIADNLDKKGEFDAADIITEAIEKQSLVKVAQYCGFSGYALRQNRALANCFRRKRAKKTNQSIHETVFECLKEYNDAQNFYETEWAKKYAEVVSRHPNNAHIVFIKELSKINNISKHASILQKCAEKSDDELIKKTLSNYNLIDYFIKNNAQGGALLNPFKK